MKEFLELTNVISKVKNPKYYAGSKVIFIPIPEPKQRGWQFMGIQQGELVYMRRRWKKEKKKK